MSVFFGLLGSAHIKAERKNVDESDRRSCFVYSQHSINAASFFYLIGFADCVSDIY